ncbi:cytochrome P450 78A5 [Amborella trichopoda]|uniref:Cytochrome P450 n=1 Tax=Amborella trichopoda TaxID=13333 RepID=U5CX29_AMBTC|nr:cytochrome P450 78A5 [Amborella trichopoda]ERN17891.1 hypothetical protein AMTR_s00047p00221540 [Amborella trichopoda]|eukprot:XP_006856424.1 cytochrome P450 78A5 [Amborella trichopoda]
MPFGMDSIWLLFAMAYSAGSPLLQWQTLTLIFLSLSILVFSHWLTPGGFAWSLVKTTQTHINGPFGFPFLGQFFMFSSPLAHSKLASTAKYLNSTGLMAFSLGFTRVIISSSPLTAKDILNSPSFANRPIKESAYNLMFHRAMGFAPYGDYWRNLRRISATYLFSPRRIEGSSFYRKVCGERMIEEIAVAMKRERVVAVRKILHLGSLNHVMKVVFGRDFDFNRGDGIELMDLVREGYELLGSFNWGDHVHFLGWLDLNGVRKRSKNLACRVRSFVGKIIEEHRAKGEANGVLGDGGGDFVDVLLNLHGEEGLGDSDMVAVLWEMIFRGTDTVAILLEWILARMVLHPEIQSKAQFEIEEFAGRFTGKTIPTFDSGINELPYLQAIVKETLRLHPPGPLLSWARLAITDVHIGHSFIPQGTMAMVNMWAITHDENIWENPNNFEPERFMREKVGVLGSDLRLAPFGSGRRVCPGKAMGLATVHLWLAQLLQNFRWLPSLDEKESVDLSERLMLSMEMERPLVCRALPRKSGIVNG